MTKINNTDNYEVVEKILHIKMRFHDPECKDVNIDDLTEFLIDTLNNEFSKDYITFEEVK
ncbi:MAG: hypothetical protein IJH63_00890 [Methanobrevibacter sp.]|nr:hypothetical protein [Methanosphaera sp.]MBR0369261.1 hypothetical protein [Methanobrevibacter sp.]